MSDEQQKDVKERSEAFIKEYGELVKKYQIDIATYPQYVQMPDTPGAYMTVLRPTTMDIKGQPTPSPFIEKEK